VDIKTHSSVTITATSVASVTVNTGGTGYTVSPTISFSGGCGTGVAANSNAYTPYTLNLEDGFYTVNSLNARIQQFCITNGMYLTDGSGNNVYYLSVSPNSTAYGKRPPYVEILNNNFGKYLGFSTGIYGEDQIANYNVLSNLI
jgi:hypothetical protein